MLPSIASELKNHYKLKFFTNRDLQKTMVPVDLPFALEKKYMKEYSGFGVLFSFKCSRSSVEVHLHHLHESSLLKALKQAVS